MRISWQPASRATSTSDKWHKERHAPLPLSNFFPCVVTEWNYASLRFVRWVRFGQRAMHLWRKWGLVSQLVYSVQRLQSTRQDLAPWDVASSVASAVFFTRSWVFLFYLGFRGFYWKSGFFDTVQILEMYNMLYYFIFHSRIQ